MSRKTTVNVLDELHEKVIVAAKYYNKPQSYIINIALELFFDNLPKVVYRESLPYLGTSVENKK